MDYLDRALPKTAPHTQTKSQARQLESQGWRVWLKTLFPFAFDEEFSEDHVRYWNLRWSVLFRIKKQREFVQQNLSIPKEFLIQDDEYVALLILGRGLAKSSSLEASAVMRGAILDGGYCLYVSEAQDQAEEHIGNCQGLIGNDDSRLLEFYPRMAVVEDATVGGIKTKNRSDIFITSNGWICRAKGLNSKLRGLRIGVQRPDDIKLDDVDSVNDSVDVSVKKRKQITSSVLPTQARRWATIDFGQNLILETGVMNQLFTGQSDALAKRHTIGVTKTFSHFEYESRIDEQDGKLKHHILPSSVATWKGVNIAQAQKFLHDSGLVTFMAEYQNEFELQREGRVLRNYSDAQMVITKSQFERVFDSKEIPDSWHKYIGHDWARTKSAYHACVAGSLAISNQNTRLPGKLFLFNLLSFDAGTQADDVGLRILENALPEVDWQQMVEVALTRKGVEKTIKDVTKLIQARRDVLADVISPLSSPLLTQKRYQRFVGSHDQNNDALEVYRRVFGLPFNPINPGETGGLEWADHYMAVDYKTAHPFKEDRQKEDGTWELGCPGFFIVVEDDKAEYPSSPTSDSLHDSDLCRFQFNNWRMRPIKLSEAGVIEHGPMKMHDDYGQMLQMILVGNKISAAPLTFSEQVKTLIPPKYQRETLKVNYSPQHEMAVNFQEARAKAQIKPVWQEFDAAGNLITENEVDY